MSLSGMALGDAYVNIMAESSQLQRGFLQAKAMSTAFVASTGASITSGIVASMIAIPAAIAAGMGYAIKEFMASEVVTKRLSDSILTVGGNVDTLMPRYEMLADNMARMTKWTDEQVMASMSSALALGMMTSKMEEAIPAAVGLAARLNIDLTSAMRILTRASNGHTQMLERYGVQLGKNLTLEQKWQKILEFGRGGMALAKGEIDTISGAFAQMRKAIGEVFESIGKGLVGTGSFKEWLQGIVDWIWRLKDSIDELTASQEFKTWVDTIVAGLRYIVNDLKLTGNMIWLSLGKPFLQSIGYIIDRLMDLTNAIYETLNLLAKGIGGAFMYLGNMLGTLGNAVVTSLWEPMKWAVESIWTIFKNMWENVKAISKAAWQEITNPFHEYEAPKTVNVLQGVSSAADMINNIGASWKTFSDTARSSSPFQPMIDQLETVRASLQTLGQGFTVNPYKGMLDEMDKAIAEWKKKDEEITASIGREEAKKMGISTEKPKATPTERAATSIMAISEMWKKMQEDLTKRKALDLQQKQLNEAEKQTMRLEEIKNEIAMSGGDSPLYGVAPA